MTSTAADSAQPWTCPFCPLLCDGFALAREGGHYRLQGSDCPRAAAALARFDDAAAAQAAPQVDGKPVALEEALDAAAALLAASRQPLIAGLGTDVDGARALYPLACATGAISDAAGGEGFLHGLRSLQDRGHFTTTLAEVRTRAELIVCFGGNPRETLPEIWRRAGIGEPQVAQREIVFVGVPTDPALDGLPGVTQRSIALAGDLFDTVGMLAARVAQRRLPAPPEIDALAGRLRDSRYAVLLWESAGLPAHGTLIVEALNQIVGDLNRHTRAALLHFGHSAGPGTANSVYTWMSGLPLRSRPGPLGLEHEPLQFDARALLAGGEVDALLWVASFGDEPARPEPALPTVVLGGPGVAAPQRGVYIPVATPGVGQGGHLFRGDGVVALPLEPVREDRLPGVAQVAHALAQRINATKRPAAA